MGVKVYNKLVRDRIPEIIEAAGKKCACETLADGEYLRMLNEKLLEEAREYIESGALEELADMGEVMHAILAYKGVSIEEFQRVRLDKLRERGGFAKRLMLKTVTETDEEERNV